MLYVFILSFWYIHVYVHIASQIANNAATQWVNLCKYFPSISHRWRNHPNWILFLENNSSCKVKDKKTGCGWAGCGELQSFPLQRLDRGILFWGETEKNNRRNSGLCIYEDICPDRNKHFYYCRWWWRLHSPPLLPLLEQRALNKQETLFKFFSFSDFYILIS